MTKYSLKFKRINLSRLFRYRFKVTFGHCTVSTNELEQNVGVICPTLKDSCSRNPPSQAISQLSRINCIVTLYISVSNQVLESITNRSTRWMFIIHYTVSTKLRIIVSYSKKKTIRKRLNESRFY